MLPPVASIPDFVWRRLDAEQLGVPLLLFHWLRPEELDAYLGWLRDARYRTLSADEVAAVARGELSCPARAVALTFDDGLYNHWAVVAPMLRRHGLRGIAFVVPRLLHEGARRPSLEDAAAGRVSSDALLDAGPRRGNMTWDEARSLADEGVLEIQSHTFDHAAVFTSDRIVDFQHPRSDGSPRYPWLWSAAGAEPDDPLWGAPVYPMAPRMAARRYHDDPAWRDACRRFVAVRGERGFFADVTWRAELARFARLDRRRFGPGRLESPADTAAERLRSLVQARELLATRLERPINHVALPWSQGAADAPRLIRAAGHRSGYTAERPSRRVQPGSDPFDLGRVEGYWLRSLPGAARTGLGERLLGRMRRLRLP